MKTLLLTSQGIQEEIKPTFKKILKNYGKDPKEIKVAFVVTAAFGEEPNPKWFEYYRKQLRSFGITEIEDLDIKEKKENELREILKNKDIIFVNGGNTFYLLEHVRESGFDKLLPELLDQGKIYIGVSAGSYIACPTIEMATWKNQDVNRMEVTDFNAINLVPFLLSVHFEEKYRQAIEENIKKTKCPVIVLTDKQAVLYLDDKYEIVGEGEKIVYNNF